MDFGRAGVWPVHARRLDLDGVEVVAARLVRAHRAVRPAALVICRVAAARPAASRADDGGGACRRDHEGTDHERETKRDCEASTNHW